MAPPVACGVVTRRVCLADLSKKGTLDSIRRPKNEKFCILGRQIRPSSTYRRWRLGVKRGGNRWVGHRGAEGQKLTAVAAGRVEGRVITRVMSVYALDTLQLAPVVSRTKPRRWRSPRSCAAVRAFDAGTTIPYQCFSKYLHHI